MNFKKNLILKKDLIVSRFFNQDKKLLVKVIAGVLLLVTAFAFYLMKNQTEYSDPDISVIPEGAESSRQADKTDAEGGFPATEAAALENAAMIVVDVAGAVVNPSVVELPEGSRVFQAVEKAGGLKPEADTGSINQAEILIDGQKVYVPTKQEREEYQSGFHSSGIPYDTGAVQPNRININTADSETLQQLSGVGPATAEKIITYRKENGKFRTIEDIKNVSGIGDKTFEKFKDKITV